MAINLLKYVNLGLIALFVILILCFLIAALRGFIRGVWKSTHNMIFMVSLIVIAFVTLNALTDAIGNFPLSFFIKGSFYVSRTIDGELVTYYVPITTIKETLTEYVKGVYTLYNVSASASSAVNFAFALASSILKVAVVIIDMIFIVTLGNLFCFLSWILIFRHFVPRVAKKKVKMRWIGLAETAITFLMVTFLFMTPFTAVVNSVNQAYKRNDVQNKTDNEMVANVGNFLNAYDNSLFAKVFFNWSVDKNGMTYDARLFDNLTTGVSGEYTINIIREIVNVTNLAASGVGAISVNNGEVSVDVGSLITKEITGKAFDAVINSTLIQSIIPIVVEVALNSDLLTEYIPARLIDLSDVKWEEEIGYIDDMVDCVFDSGVLDYLFEVKEDGKRVMRKLEGNDLATFIENVVYSENFVDLLDIFKSIDKSKVLSRAVPALLQFVVNSDEEGVAKQYLPLTWDELNELSWGYETYVLFDFLHSVAKLDNNFLRTIFVKTGLYKVPEGDTTDYNLASLISAHAEEFKALVVGKTNASGDLVDVDDYGQTEVFDESGNRIENRNYCLFDMNLVNKVLPTLLDKIFDLEALKDVRAQLNDSDLDLFHQTVASLNNGNRLINYKKEFNSILDVVATVAKDTELLDALINGKGFESLMQEEGNFFSIDVSHVNYFKQAITKMDNSVVLYSALAPMLKSLIKGDDITNTLNDIGLKSSVLASAIEHDLNKSNHTLFSDFSSLLDKWEDLGNIVSLSSSGNDTDALMTKLKDGTIITSFKNVLNLLIDNPLINPTPQAGDEYEKNENLYGLLEYVFSMTSDLGLTVTRDLLRTIGTNEHTWSDEIDAIGNILQFIAVHDLANASSSFENGLTRSGIAKLVGHSDDDYYIKGLFDAVGSSYIFKDTLGPFLDDMFGDSLSGFLIDKENNVSFSNISDWSKEGQNIENMLKTLENILPENDDEAANFFNNLNLTTFDEIVDLNAMLHDIANSGIFTYIDENNVSHYQFGKWLYNIIDSSMGSFTVDENSYDLLSDPKFGDDSIVQWNTEKWGIRPEDGSNPDKYYLEWQQEYNSDGSKTDTHYIVYKDFVYANGMDNSNPDIASFWCDYTAFTNAQAAFIDGEYGDPFVVPASYLNNDWKAYYGSDDFMRDYENVFAVDEISRVMRFTCYAMRILQPRPALVDADPTLELDKTKIPFNEIPKDLLEGLLSSLNETHCMRAGIYNFYRIAADNVFNSYSSSGFSLSSCYASFMIDADLEMFDFEHARPIRAAELDILTDFYDLINIAKEDDVLSGDTFVFTNIRNNGFLNVLESTLSSVNDSYVFHCKGSSKINQLTTFQGLFNHLLGDSEIGNSIYLGNKSPKDAHNASLYSSASEKVRYLVETSFPDDAHNSHGNRDAQKNEIHQLMQAVDELYSLKKSNGEIATSISDADLKNDENIETIRNALLIINDSQLLCDLVPNTIYKLFIDEPQFSVTSGSYSVDFACVDPFYHYYFNVDTLTQLTTPNFNAKYSLKDINGIRQLLIDYEAFDGELNGGDITNCDTLKLLTGTVDAYDKFYSTGALSDLLYTLHNNPIFHTPARNYVGSDYYTNKYQTGYTLFEEMMSNICKFVGLHDFAYDSGFDSEASASVKLYNNIKAITLADDGKGTGICYHTANGLAWNQEIHSIMETAYRVADASSGATIDIDHFNLEDLSPESVKNVLTALNSSDLVGDAVPNFVKDGFEAINLGTLTTYETTNYANYHIGKVGYGGSDAKAENGTEIDNIYHVLTALRNGSAYVDNVSDISDFVANDSTGERLEGLLRYVYESRILNTPHGGEYRSYYTVSSYKITAQGILLYNAFNNSGLASFIARDALTTTSESTALEKIQQLSIIVHMPYEDSDAIAGGLTYTVESKGLTYLITETNNANIDGSSFSGAGQNDINNVKNNYREPILNIMNIAYNSDGSGHRSALVSELVAGLLNNVMENEYNGLYSKAGYAFNEFTFGKPASESLIKYKHYNSINLTEKNGLEGILNSLDYASQLNASTLMTMSDDQRHELANNLEACFALMTTGGQNSEIARIVYLNDFHQVLKPLAAVPNKDMQAFVSYLVNETSTSTEADSRTVYSSNFSFATYGTALKNYIYPGFY